MIHTCRGIDRSHRSGRLRDSLVCSGDTWGGRRIGKAWRHLDGPGIVPGTTRFGLPGRTPDRREVSVSAFGCWTCFGKRVAGIELACLAWEASPPILPKSEEVVSQQEDTVNGLVSQVESNHRRYKQFIAVQAELNGTRRYSNLLV